MYPHHDRPLHNPSFDALQPLPVPHITEPDIVFTREDTPPPTPLEIRTAKDPEALNRLLGKLAGNLPEPVASTVTPDPPEPSVQIITTPYRPRDSRYSPDTPAEPLTDKSIRTETQEGEVGSVFEGVRLEIERSSITAATTHDPSKSDHSERITLKAPDYETVIAAAVRSDPHELRFTILPQTIPTMQEAITVLLKSTDDSGGVEQQKADASGVGQQNGVTRIVLDSPLTRQDIVNLEEGTPTPIIDATRRALASQGYGVVDIGLVDSHIVQGAAVSLSFEPRSGQDDRYLSPPTSRRLSSDATRLLGRIDTDIENVKVSSDERIWIKTHAPDSRVWRLVDTGLSDMNIRFRSVIPDGVRIEDFLNTHLPSVTNNIGMEVGGISSTFFYELKQALPGRFAHSYGVSLNDLRNVMPDGQELITRDAKTGHSVITGNIYTPETKADIVQKLNGQKPTFILQSMMGGLRTLPNNPFDIAEEANFWYKLLDKGGVMLMQVPRSMTPYMRRWANDMNSKTSGIKGYMYQSFYTAPYMGGMLLLQKQPDAPDSLPFLSAADIIRIQRRYGYDTLHPRMKE